MTWFHAALQPIAELVNTVPFSTNLQSLFLFISSQTFIGLLASLALGMITWRTIAYLLNIFLGVYISTQWSEHIQASKYLFLFIWSSFTLAMFTLDISSSWLAMLQNPMWVLVTGLILMVVIPSSFAFESVRHLRQEKFHS